MAYRRKWKKRRTYRRRSYKRSYGRYRRTSRYGRSQSATVKFARSQRWGSIVSDAAGTTSIAIQWRLNDVLNYTEFTTLFDQYRIDKMVIRLIPYNPNVVQYGDANLGSALDYDSSSLMTVDQLREYSTFKPARLDKKHTRVLYPRQLTNVFTSTAGVGGTGYAPTRVPWLSTTSSNVVHYAFKFAGNVLPINTQMYEVYIDTHMSFKNYK